MRGLKPVKQGKEMKSEIDDKYIILHSLTEKRLSQRKERKDSGEYFSTRIYEHLY